jgi:penicillin-binding protein 2
MERDSTRHKVFGRRAAILGGFKLTLAAVLVGRMYYLQVVESKQYQMLAEENRINMRLLSPPRGLLFDRFGRKVAHNRQNYRVVMVAEQTSDIEATIERLSAVVPITPGQRGKILKEVRRRRPFVPVTVAENLTWEQFSRLNVVLPDLAGVQPDIGESRFYEYDVSLAHVVGYVSAVSEKELTGDPLLELPGFRIGKNGVEKIFDESLRGRAGNQRIEVNAYGRVIRELARRDGEAGDDIVLTIDAELQKAISQRLADESAAAVVMDIHTGELLALVSTPAYDPNAFNVGLTSKAWRELVRHERAPLTNKAISGQYPPGSTIKMLVALAGLEAGIISPSQKFFCNGRIKLGNATFHCWRHRYGGHGWIDMKQGIAQSCDVYFYEVARKIGIDRISAMAERFGLGQMLGVDLPAERAGLVPTPDWKMAVIGQPWQLGETLITGIGQAYMLATPLQLATMTARMANGGFAVAPHVIRAKRRSGFDRTEEYVPARAEPIGVSRANLDVVLDAMSEVVNGKRGTARASRLDEELGLQMAGKTGTAQVRRITKAEREAGGKQAEDTPWKYRDHALFVSFAPVNEPRYAVAVIVEHGRSGTYAAKLTKDIMTEVLSRDPLGEPAFGALDGPKPRVREG